MPRPAVYGTAVDGATGCAHYRSHRDVLAFKLPCCDRFYACIDCHEATTDHTHQPITAPDTAAVLCGRCGTVHTPRVYLQSDHECPVCDAAFNPGCEAHYDEYFGFDVTDVRAEA